MKRNAKFLVAVLLVLSAFGSVGCSENKETPGRTVSTTNTEADEIKRIENDPNMPAQAKAAAIQGLKAKQEAARKTDEAHSQAPK